MTVLQWRAWAGTYQSLCTWPVIVCLKPHHKLVRHGSQNLIRASDQTDPKPESIRRQNYSTERASQLHNTKSHSSLGPRFSHTTAGSLNGIALCSVSQNGCRGRKRGRNMSVLKKWASEKKRSELQLLKNYIFGFEILCCPLPFSQTGTWPIYIFN